MAMHDARELAAHLETDIAAETATDDRAWTRSRRRPLDYGQLHAGGIRLELRELVVDLIQRRLRPDEDVRSRPDPEIAFERAGRYENDVGQVRVARHLRSAASAERTLERVGRAIVNDVLVPREPAKAAALNSEPGAEQRAVMLAA